MKKFLNLAVSNKICRDSYEETEYWFLQIPEQLAPLARQFANFLLGISLYQVEACDGFENQNLVRVISGEAVDDQRDQLITVNNIYKLSDEKFNAAVSLQSIMHHSIFNWVYVIDSLSEAFVSFLQTFSDEFDEFKTLIGQSDDREFYEIFLKHLANLDSDNITVNTVNAIILDLEKLASAIGKVHLAEIID